jgi:2,3-bisphosphoglycerate-independent phosphoglycerate mutase
VIRDGDVVIFFNFRPDRAREMTRVFVERQFSEFPRSKVKVHFVCMMQYEPPLWTRCAFPPRDLSDTLGE